MADDKPFHPPVSYGGHLPAMLQPDRHVSGTGDSGRPCNENAATASTDDPTGLMSNAHQHVPLPASLLQEVPQPPSQKRHKGENEPGEYRLDKDDDEIPSNASNTSPAIGYYAAMNYGLPTINLDETVPPLERKARTDTRD